MYQIIRISGNDIYLIAESLDEKEIKMLKEELQEAYEGIHKYYLRKVA